MNSIGRTPGPNVAWFARPGVRAIALLAFSIGLCAAPVRAEADRPANPGAEVEPNVEGPPPFLSPVAPRVVHDAANAGPSAVTFSRLPGFAGGGLAPTQLHPPDPHGAVGPQGILQVVNHYIRYMRKGGPNALADTLLDQFFPNTGNVIDPRAQYDPVTQRFFVVGLEPHKLPPGPYFANLRLAVSKTSDPTTFDSNNWYFFKIAATDTVEGELFGADYPQTGFDGSAFYISCNMWRLPFDGSEYFLQPRIFILDKLALESGQLVQKSVTAATDAFTLQPATVVGAASPGNVAYFAEVYSYSSTQVRVWALTDPLGTPQVSSAFVTVPNHGGPIEGAPQCGTSIRISTLAPRAQGNVFWRNGALWLCHTSGGAAGRSIVFWYDVRTNGFPLGTPTLGKSGGVDGGPGVWNYQPSIGGNPAGDVALAFTQSSASRCPTLMATVLQSGSTEFPVPDSVKTSPSYYNGADPNVDRPYARWGDYGTVCADPVDGSFWVSHELANGTSEWDLWGTEWANLQLPPGLSAWAPGGRPVRASVTVARQPLCVPDGAGGTFVAWADRREVHGTAVSAVYVQHLTGTGAVAAGWSEGGRFVGPLLSDDPGNFALAPDGSGGAFVAWTDGSSLRVQRFGATGAAAGWPASGLSLAATSVAQLQAAPDGRGGVLLAWSHSGVRVQRVGGNAAIRWSAGGVVVGSTGTQPRIADDGEGGAYVAWTPSIKAQHLDSTGVALWVSSGVTVATGATSARLVSDGGSGCYVAFLKSAAGGSQDVVVQRLAASTGSPDAGWSAPGLRLTPAGNHPSAPVLVPDGAGGALACWTDDRHGAPSGLDVFASRVVASGAVAPGWVSDGVPVCLAPGDQSAAAIACDGPGGAIVAWTDPRSSVAMVYARRISASGDADAGQPVDGAALAPAPGAQGAACVVLAGSGQAVVVWEDARLDPGCDLADPCALSVYAQAFPFDAVPPAPVTSFTATFGHTTALLAWIESGDDGDAGTARRFDVRVATGPISTDAQFAAATPVAGIPAPAGAGTFQCVVVPGLDPCTVHAFAVRAVDDGGNTSSLSVSVSGSTDCSGTSEVSCATGVGPEPGTVDVPARLELPTPTPNPSSGDLVVTFGVPASEAGHRYDLALFDVTGRRVMTLGKGVTRAGRQSLPLRRREAAGGLPAGRYFLRWTVGRSTLSTGMIILR